mmetsp:Transcript_93124/g.226210  ORF Transcript_93124/g.226210 Transcript_93124/m.226210 type:complete len:206 (-) Transcript_93124:446-1063(-)
MLLGHRDHRDHTCALGCIRGYPDARQGPRERDGLRPQGGGALPKRASRNRGLQRNGLGRVLCLGLCREGGLRLRAGSRAVRRRREPRSPVLHLAAACHAARRRRLRGRRAGPPEQVFRVPRHRHAHHGLLHGPPVHARHRPSVRPGARQPAARRVRPGPGAGGLPPGRGHARRQVLRRGRRAGRALAARWLVPLGDDAGPAEQDF